MKGTRLSEAGVALLRFIADSGPVPRVLLLQAQRARCDGRTEAAINRMPEGLKSLDLVRHVPGATPRLWEITPVGRQALDAWKHQPDGPPVSLGVASRAVLQCLADHGPCDGHWLAQVQRHVLPSRKTSTTSQLVCDLVRRGLTVKVGVERPARWAITAHGLAALAGQALAGDPREASDPPLTTPPIAAVRPAGPARRIASVAPRWVFDLGSRSDAS